jgi:hypothetical protein
VKNGKARFSNDSDQSQTVMGSIAIERSRDFAGKINGTYNTDRRKPAFPALKIQLKVKRRKVFARRFITD